jgi:hypothetical protein
MSPLRSGREAIQASWKRYLVVLAALTMLVVAIIIVSPWPYAVAVEYLALPELEPRFGFRGARLPIPGTPSSQIYAIAEVFPGGVLAQAGVLPGDAPVAIRLPPLASAPSSERMERP